MDMLIDFISSFTACRCGCQVCMVPLVNVTFLGVTILCHTNYDYERVDFTRDKSHVYVEIKKLPSWYWMCTVKTRDWYL